MIHPSAVVGDDVQIDEVDVGPFAVIGVDGPGEAPAVGRGTTVRSHAVVYRSTRIGQRVHLGHGVLVREFTVVEDDASVGSHTVLEHHVAVGTGARLHSGCFVPEHSVIGAWAWLGPGVIVTNARYPNRPDTKDSLEGVHIEEGAVVGAGVVLLPGVVIGAGSLIGAGAVVVRDVRPGSRVVGNPAHSVREENAR